MPETTRTIHDATLRLTQGDITEAAVDAVVNAANSSLMGGGGVDGAIHRRGGPAILDACKQIRAEQYPDGLPTGEAVVTTAGELPAEKVIHTVGPRWHGGEEGEADLLANAYRHALDQAQHHDLHSVAFPSISTGAYGYPIDQAARIALQTVLDVLDDHPGAFDEVRFVLFSASDFATYDDALSTLTSS
jgi:O-acetyl-ADP-ribose deacetylase (regulator of RNase III)